MPRFTSPLGGLRIAAPCSADWDQMMGNQRVRFCAQCNLNVYNLSELSKTEAEDFIARNEGRLCVRFYRRADGSVLTKNCPVGLRAIKRRLSRIAQAVTTTVLSFFAGVSAFGFFEWMRPASSPVMGVLVAQPVVGMVLEIEPMRPTMGKITVPAIPVMGDISPRNEESRIKGKSTEYF
jgi:hypothetical protein